MKLNAREDIAAPIDAVFAQISDFTWFERAAMRRGADVVRTDPLLAPGPGMSWHVAFAYRGRDRKADIKLVRYESPQEMAFELRAAGLEIAAVVELVALSRARTRMNVTMDVTPKTIPARLMLQSAKLARTSLVKRFRRRMGDYAAELEARCKVPGA